ncbi:MAG: ABC transporter permease [Desulfarculus sp.]|nr:ABC transporter permease [Pseudomonadota bacterium]MBV1714405.1 ABC transporter permease [Desulfarculus sp.]MBU4576884.1 ABC transporter permease [Pseudomonadota bacterium]MBU4597960.1 ABC transporter permease [Pseudomonadota bacterium]MBV1738261.1 ABC transporter permease [Desulfarculus sp.]
MIAPRTRRLMAAAWDGLWGHRLRASLAAGGLLVGVAAVVVMVAVGQGTRNQVLARITALGTNLISIHSAKRAFTGLRSRTTGEVSSLEPADAEAISRLEGARAASALEMRLMRMSGPEGTTDALVIAAQPNIFLLEDHGLAEGRYFTEREERSGRRVAVVGPALREHLAGDGSLVGRTIEVKKQPFLVVGELLPKGVDASGNDLDERLYLPLKTAQSRLLSGRRYVGLLLVRGEDESVMEPLAQDITTLLRQRHNLRTGQPDDFKLHTQLETIQAREESNRVFSATITGVAAVSLLVAGVGIMAVLLISVKERTTEIGLRRALGARRRDILWQFLAEAIILGLAGSGGGALLGLAAALAIRIFGSLDFALPVSPALGAGFLGLAISMVFGLAPARRAAALTPVDALRD